MTAPSLEPPYAYVVEHRPLDRCSPPACTISGRRVAGYAKDVQDDGEPGSYIAHGGGTPGESFFQRGVFLRAENSFSFDLPPATYASELDVSVGGTAGGELYDVELTTSVLLPTSSPVVLSKQHITGKSAPFADPKANELGRFERYGAHLRVPLPPREGRTIRVTFTAHGHQATLGSPLVMRRVEGRGPRQGLLVVHDAVPFYQAHAFLFGGTNDPASDWVRAAVADRGVYFPLGQSPGQGTADFIIRSFRGTYFAASGWPGMYGKGFDETLPARLPGPIARAAELGFVTAFFGNNYIILPGFAHVGWDTGYHSEHKETPATTAALVERWAHERPHDDTVMVLWNSATHAPYPPGRPSAGPPPPPPMPDEPNRKPIDGVWRNLMEGSDHLRRAYDALRRAAPHASRVMWLGSDHSTSISGKMVRRPYRLPMLISTGIGHACSGTAEEANTPFAVVYDGPSQGAPGGRGEGRTKVVRDRTSSFVLWRAMESHFGVDLELPRSSTFRSEALGSPDRGTDWQDRILVSVGFSGTIRGSAGDTSYTLFERKLDQKPAWELSDGEQLVMLGAPSRSNGFQDEELYDDPEHDPYEYDNRAGTKPDATLRMRSEMVDWMSTYYDDAAHSRYASRLQFGETTELDIVAPTSFTAIVNDTVVPSSDPHSAHINAKEVVLAAGAEPLGIVELRGLKGRLTVRCSANGLPVDVLDGGRVRLNLDVARVNCPQPAKPRDVARLEEALFSFEPSHIMVAPRGGGTSPTTPGGSRAGGQNDELLAGMKRWGYVRDIDDKKKP